MIILLEGRGALTTDISITARVTQITESIFSIIVSSGTPRKAQKGKHPGPTNYYTKNNYKKAKGRTTRQVTKPTIVCLSLYSPDHLKSPLV